MLLEKCHKARGFIVRLFPYRGDAAKIYFVGTHKRCQGRQIREDSSEFLLCLQLNEGCCVGLSPETGRLLM